MDAKRNEIEPGVYEWTAYINGQTLRHVTTDPELELHAVGVVNERGIGGKLVDERGETVAFIIERLR